MVKAFNNIYSEFIGSLARPAGDPERSVLLVAGDDEGAKKIVSGLVDDIGFDAYDAGPLADSWRFERDQPAYGAPYQADEPGSWPPQHPQQATAAAFETALGQAERVSDGTTRA